MAKGETSFDASKRKVSKFDRSPPRPAEYHFKFRSSKAAIAVADGVGKVPYINGCQFELLDSGEDGGKNKSLFKAFFLGTVPAPGSKAAAVDQGDGLVAFSKSIGVNLRLGEGAVISKSAKDRTGKDYTATILDPKKVVAWLKEQDGTSGSLKSRIRPDKNDPDKKYGDVDYFIEAEEAGEEDEEKDEEKDEEGEDEEDETDEDEAESDDDEETDEDEEDEDEDEDEEDDEEEKPAKKKVKAGKKKSKK